MLIPPLGATSLVVLWFAVMVLALIVEGIVPGLISIWFAVGAAAAVVAASLHAPFGVQMAAFILVTCASLILTRPLAAKYVNSRTQRTNADRVIGEEAIVTEQIDTITGTGLIKAFGQVWTARPEPSTEIIPAGERVRVIRIEGAKAIVQKIPAGTVMDAEISKI